jgi:hypothetical protein
MDNSALTPQALPIMQIFGNMKKEQETTFDALKEADIRWQEFGNSYFYGMIKEYIDNLNNALDELEARAFESGASLEEIGLRRAVNRLVKANLNSLTNKVNGTTRQPIKPAGPQPSIS